MPLYLGGKRSVLSLLLIVQSFLSLLQSWCDTCDTMLSNIDQLITRANTDKERHLKHRNSLETEVSGSGLK